MHYEDELLPLRCPRRLHVVTTANTLNASPACLCVFYHCLWKPSWNEIIMSNNSMIVPVHIDLEFLRASGNLSHQSVVMIPSQLHLRRGAGIPILDESFNSAAHSLFHRHHTTKQLRLLQHCCRCTMSINAEFDNPSVLMLCMRTIFELSNVQLSRSRSASVGTACGIPRANCGYISLSILHRSAMCNLPDAVRYRPSADGSSNANMCASATSATSTIKNHWSGTMCSNVPSMTSFNLW
eukprot:COSAG02_NODE_9975_length_2059_cov_6.620945_3_plen_239_part_00